MKGIGEGLAGLRMSLGVSQVELSKQMEVVQSRVSAIEGSENVTMNVLIEYLRALGASQLVMTAVFDDSSYEIARFSL